MNFKCLKYILEEKIDYIAELEAEIKQRDSKISELENKINLLLSGEEFKHSKFDWLSNENIVSIIVLTPKNNSRIKEAKNATR